MSFQNKFANRIFNCSPEQIAKVKSEGVLVFGRTPDKIAKWLSFKRGDVFVAKGSGARCSPTCKVTTRGFLLSPKSVSQPSLSMASLALGVTSKDFNLKYPSDMFRQHLELGPYKVAVSQNTQEDAILDNLLSDHCYGRSSGLVNFLVEKSGLVVGGARLDKYEPDMFNSTPSRTIQCYSNIRDRMYVLRRIVNSRPDIASSLRIQELCYRISELLCASVADANGVILVGNSYEFLFSAIRRGFQCEIPETREHSIFYWKRIGQTSASDTPISVNEFYERSEILKPQFDRYKRGPVSNRYRPKVRNCSPNHWMAHGQNTRTIAN